MVAQYCQQEKRILNQFFIYNLFILNEFSVVFVIFNFFLQLKTLYFKEQKFIIKTLKCFRKYFDP